MMNGLNNCEHATVVVPFLVKNVGGTFRNRKRRLNGLSPIDTLILGERIDKNRINGKRKHG